MTHPFQPILAAWRDLGNQFSGHHAQFKWSDAVSLVGILLAGVALVLLMIWLQRRQLRRERSNHPAHLFQDLCRAHALSWRQRWLLRRLAEELDLKLRAVMFVRPDLFAGSSLPESLAPYHHAYEELRNKLFAGLEEPPASSATSPGSRPATSTPIVATALPQSSAWEGTGGSVPNSN